MQEIEKIIRTNLAKNLSFIDSNLELIKEEYSLPNYYGSKGYIDILAKDSDNNYVIIEVKRSNQSARQALHEITKYHSLLQQHFHVKNSEIRTIIISTEWAELLVPFSEFKKDSQKCIDGYRLEIDDDYSLKNLTYIEPLKGEWTRNLSRGHHIFLYETDKLFGESIEKTKLLLPSFGIDDFIILKMKSKKEIPFPFALYLIHQRYDEERYLEIIKQKADNDADCEDVISNINYSEDEQEEYILYLEYLVLRELINGENKLRYDSLELGYPEKLQANLTRGWSIIDIVKYGFFETDLRLTNEMLIYEILGFDGNNQTFYINQTSSKNKSKVLEIQKGIENFLRFNVTWKKHISAILSKLNNNEIVNYRLGVSIFNTDNILESIAGASYYNSEEYFPTYEIFIEDLDQNSIQIYRGGISWNEKSIQLNRILNDFFRGDLFNFFLERQFGTIANLDSKIMNYLGLTYISQLYEVKDDEMQCYDLNFDDGILKKETENKKMFKDFIVKKDDFVKDVTNMYKIYSIGFL